eukprot:1309285-Amphidinium_carterae.2
MNRTSVVVGGLVVVVVGVAVVVVVAARLSARLAESQLTISSFIGRTRCVCHIRSIVKGMERPEEVAAFTEGAFNSIRSPIALQDHL